MKEWSGCGCDILGFWEGRDIRIFDTRRDCIGFGGLRYWVMDLE